MPSVQLVGSGKLSATKSGLKGERIWRVWPYSIVDDFLVQLVGKRQRIGTFVIDIPPAAFKSGSSMYCVSASAEPIGKAGQDAHGHATYADGAKVTAQYETLAFDPENKEGIDTYLTESLSFSAQAITLEAKKDDNTAAWEWVNDGTKVGGNDGENAPELVKLIPTCDYSMQRHKVPELPKATILATIGKINSSEFGDCAAETLLFLGANCNRVHTSDGTRAWEVGLSFSYNPNNHNKIYRPGGSGGGSFQYVRNATDTAKRIYETTSFDVLLTA